MLIFRATRSSSLKSTLRAAPQLLNFSSDDKKSPPPSPIPNNDENTVEKSSQNAPETEKKVKQSTADRLNALLASMQTDDHLTVGKKIDIPLAGGGKKKREKLKAIEKEKREKQEKSEDIIEAAKNVANMIDGDKEQKKQTESELLAKLLNHIDGGAGADSSNVKADDKLNLAEMSLNDLIVGMKIDRQQKSSSNDTPSSGMGYQISRSQYVRNTLDGKRSQQQQLTKDQQKDDFNSKKYQERRKKLNEPPKFTGSSVNLFGSEPLGIFTKPNELNDQIDILPTWSLLQQKQLKLIGMRSPKNYFEKIARWTDNNKVWQFPIDNEQGMINEDKVDFSEHIFLEQHLEGWCPIKGPIRHFMELVCVGLSKNPYISAADKKDHILWYRDYFDKKKDVLKDLIGTTTQTTTSEHHQDKKQINLTIGCSGSISPGTQIFTNNLRLSSLLIRKPGINFTAKIHSKSEENINVLATEREKPIKKESLNETYEKKICFIGHSCTWLPIPTTIKTIKSEDIERKIIFLGHSCTWLPKSASVSLLKSTLVEPSLVVQSDLKPDNTNINYEQEILDVTNTFKSDINVNSSTSPKNDDPVKIESVNLGEPVIEKKQAIKEVNNEDKQAIKAAKDEHSFSNINKLNSLKQSMKRKLHENKENPASQNVSELIQKSSQKDVNLNSGANKSVQIIDEYVAIDEKVNELKTTSSITSDIYSNELESDSSTEQINKLLENSNTTSINSQPVKIIESTVVVDNKTNILKIIPTEELINMKEKVTKTEELINMKEEVTKSFERNSIEKNMALMGGNSSSSWITYDKPTVKRNSQYTEDKVNNNLDDIAISEKKDVPQAQKNMEIDSQLISKKDLQGYHDNTKSLPDITLAKSSNKAETQKQTAIPEIHNEVISNSKNGINSKLNKTVIKIVSDQKTDSVNNKKSELKSSTTNLESAPKKSSENPPLSTPAESDYKKYNHNKSSKEIYCKKVEIKNEKDNNFSINNPQSGRLTKLKWTENVLKNQDKNSKQITESHKYPIENISKENDLTQSKFINNKSNISISDNIKLNSTNPSNNNEVNKYDEVRIEGNNKISSSVNKTMTSEKNLVFMGHSCAWIPEDFGVTPSPETLVENIEVKEKEVNKFQSNQYSKEFMQQIKTNVNIPDNRSLRKEKLNPKKENYSKMNPTENSKRNIVFMGHSCAWIPENIAKVELNTTRTTNDPVISNKQLNNETNIKPKLSSVLLRPKENGSNTKESRKLLNVNDQGKTNKDTKIKKSSTQNVNKPIEVLFNSKLNINNISKKESKSNESLPIVARNSIKEINSTKSAEAILTKPPVKPNIGYFVFQDLETPCNNAVASTIKNISVETGVVNENSNTKKSTGSDPMKNIYTKNPEQMETKMEKSRAATVDTNGFVLESENKNENNNKQSTEKQKDSTSSKNIGCFLIEELSKDNLKKIDSKEILKISDNESNMKNLIKKKSLKQMELPLKGVSSKEVAKSKKEETKLQKESGIILKKDKNSDITVEKNNKVLPIKLETTIKAEQSKTKIWVDNKKIPRYESNNSFNKIQSNKCPSTEINSKAILNLKPTLQKPDMPNPSLNDKTEIENKVNKIVKIGPVKKPKVFKTRSNIPISKSRRDRRGSGKYTEQSVNETIILGSMKEGDSVKKRGRSYRAFKLKPGTFSINKIQQTDSSVSENMEVEKLNAMQILKKHKIDSSNTFSSTIMKKIESCMPIDSSSKEKIPNSQKRGSKDEQIVLKLSSNESNIKEKINNVSSIVTSKNSRTFDVADNKLNKSKETYIKNKNVTDKIFKAVKTSTSESTNIPEAAKNIFLDTGFVLVNEDKNQNIDNTKKLIPKTVTNPVRKTIDQKLPISNIENKTASDYIIDSLKTSTSESMNIPESNKNISLETGFVLVNEHKNQNIDNIIKSTETDQVKNISSKTCDKMETNYENKIAIKKCVSDLNNAQMIKNSKDEKVNDEHAQKILKKYKIDTQEPSFQIKSNVTENLENIKSVGSKIEAGTDSFNKATNNKLTRKFENNKDTKAHKNKETKMATEINATNILKSLKIDNFDEWKTKNSIANKHEPSEYISKKEIKSEIITEQHLSGNVDNRKDRDKLDNAVTKSEAKPVTTIKDPTTSKMESTSSIPIKQAVTSNIENTPSRVPSRNRNKGSGTVIKSKNDNTNIILSPVNSVSVEASDKDKELLNLHEKDLKKTEVIVNSLYNENAMKKLQKHKLDSFSANISAATEESDTVRKSITNESNARFEIQSKVDVLTEGVNLAHNTEPEIISKNETIMLKPINLKVATRPKQREVDIFKLWKSKKEEALKLSNTPIKSNENIIDKIEENFEEHKSPLEIDTIIKENLENTASKLGISKLNTETKECGIPNFNGTEQLDKSRTLSNPRLVVYSSNNLKFSSSKWEKVDTSKKNNSIKENIPIVKNETSGSNEESVITITSPFKKYSSNNLKPSATKLNRITTSNENNTVEIDPTLMKEISGKEDANKLIIKSPVVENSPSKKNNSVEKSPLEKYSFAFDLKLKRIQDDLDKDCLNKQPEIKPHKNKETVHIKIENLADQNTIEKTRRKFQNIASSKKDIDDRPSKTNSTFNTSTNPNSIPNDVTSNVPIQDKLGSKLFENNELKELKKTYVPLSFSITSPVKKKVVNDPYLDQYKKYIIESTTSAQKINKVDSTNSKTPISNNSESLFQQLKNMIREDLFTYPKETDKEIKLNNKKEPNSKLSVESCAAQPSIDSTIKPESILKQVKNLIKEELFVSPENAQGSEKLNSNTGLTLKRVQIDENETKDTHLKVPDLKALPIKKSDTNIISVDSINKDTSVINIAQSDSKNVPKEPIISSKTNKIQQSLKQETPVTKIAQIYNKNESKDSTISSESNSIKAPTSQETLLVQAKNTLIESTSLRAPILEKSDQIISPRISPESILDKSKPSILTSSSSLNIKDSNTISNTDTVTSKAGKDLKKRKQENDGFIEGPFSGEFNVPINLSRKQDEHMRTDKPKEVIHNSEIEVKPWGETVSHPATIMNKIKAFFKDDSINNFSISKTKTGIFESSSGSSRLNDTKVVKEDINSNNQNSKDEADISLHKSDHISGSEEIRKFTTESLLKYKTENLKSALTKELSTDDSLNKPNSQNSNDKTNLTFENFDAKKSLNLKKKSDNFERSNNITVDESSSSITRADVHNKDIVSQMKLDVEDASSTKSIFKKVTDYFQNNSEKSVSISKNQEKLDSKTPEIEPSIEKISLLDHLTNINTEQIKYDNNIKLLAESKLGSTKELNIKIEDIQTQPENTATKMGNIAKTSAGNMTKSILKSNEGKVIVNDKEGANILDTAKIKSAENINVAEDDTLKFLDMIGVTKSDDKTSNIEANYNDLKVDKNLKKPEENERIKTESAKPSLPTETTDNIRKTTKMIKPKSLESYISSLDMMVGVSKSDDSTSYKIKTNSKDSTILVPNNLKTDKSLKKPEEMIKTDVSKLSQYTETTDNIRKTTKMIKPKSLESYISSLDMTVGVSKSDDSTSYKIGAISKDPTKLVSNNNLKTDKYLKKPEEIIKTDVVKSSQSTETADNISNNTKIIKPQILEPSVSFLAMTEITNSDNSITSKDLTTLDPDNVIKTNKYLKKPKEIIKTDDAKTSKSTETIDNIRKMTEIITPKSFESFPSSLDMTIGLTKSDNSTSYKIETTSKDSTKLVPNNDLKTDKYLKKPKDSIKTDAGNLSQFTESADNILKTTNMIKPKSLEPSLDMKIGVIKSNDSISYKINATSKDSIPLVPDNYLKIEKHLKKSEEFIKTDASKSSESTETKDNILKTTKVIIPKIWEISDMNEVLKSEDSQSTKSTKYLKKLEEMTKTYAAKPSESNKSTDILNTTKMIKPKILESIVSFSDMKEVTKSNDKKSYKIEASSDDSTTLSSNNVLKTDECLKKPEEMITTDLAKSSQSGETKNTILKSNKMIKPEILETSVFISDMNKVSKSGDSTSYKIAATSEDTSTLSLDIAAKTAKYIKKLGEVTKTDAEKSSHSTNSSDKTTKMIKPKILESAVSFSNINAVTGSTSRDSTQLVPDKPLKTENEEMIKTDSEKSSQSPETKDNNLKTTKMRTPKILQSTVSFPDMIGVYKSVSDNGLTTDKYLKTEDMIKPAKIKTKGLANNSIQYDINVKAEISPKSEASSKTLIDEVNQKHRSKNHKNSVEVKLAENNDSSTPKSSDQKKSSPNHTASNSSKPTADEKPSVLNSSSLQSTSSKNAESDLKNSDSGETISIEMDSNTIVSDNGLATGKYLKTEDMIKPAKIKTKSLANNSIQYDINLKAEISPKSEALSKSLIDGANQKHRNKNYKNSVEVKLAEKNELNTNSVSKNENDSSTPKSSDKKKSSQNHTSGTNSSKPTADDKPSVLNFSSLPSTSSKNVESDLQNSDSGGTISIEMDRYNSFEATPFNKNEIVVKILNALKLASIKKD